MLAVTQLLDKPEAGTLFVTTSIFLILLAAVELGATTGLVRWIPQYLAAGREGDLRALLRTSLLPVLVVSTAVAALLWPLAPWAIDVLAPHGSGGTGSTDGPAVLRLLALFLPVAAVYDLLLAATRGFDRIRPTVMVERIGRVPGQLLLVAVAGLVSHQLVAVSVAWALPYLPGLLVAGWLTVKLLLRAERMTEVARSAAPPTGPLPVLPATAPPGSGVAGEFWRYTWARGLSRIFQVALQRLDIVLISAMLGTRDAAVYTAATRLVPVGLLGVQAVQQVLQPQLAKLLALHDLPAARRIYRASTAWAVALSWPVYCTAAVTAPLVLQLFGEGYQAGAGAMVWVSVAMLVATASGAADLALLMSGRSMLSLWNTLAALVADVLLNLLLLPRLGITGAGIAWAVAILLTNLPPLEQVRRYVGLAPFSRGATLVGATSLVLFGGGSYAAGRLFPGSVVALLGWLLLAGVAYLAVLHRARRLLDLDDLLASLRGRRGGAGGTGGAAAGAAAGGVGPDGAAAGSGPAVPTVPGPRPAAASPAQGLPAPVPAWAGPGGAGMTTGAGTAAGTTTGAGPDAAPAPPPSATGAALQEAPVGAERPGWPVPGTPTLRAGAPGRRAQGRHVAGPRPVARHLRGEGRPALDAPPG